MNNDFDEIIDDIEKNVNKLKTVKNVNEIINLRNKNETDIENTLNRLLMIKNVFESYEPNINTKMTDDDYIELSSSIADDIKKIKKIDDLELKIKEFMKLSDKINSCIHFISNKKMTVVDCE